MSDESSYGDKPATNIQEEMGVEDARIASGRDAVRVLDVRSQEEVADGTVPGAMWAPEDKLEEMARYVLRGDEKPIMLVDSDGSRAPELAQRLRDADFEACYLSGGFPSWREKGFPEDPRDATEYEGPDTTMPGTGDGGGGDESAEEAKIAEARAYYDEEEERTGVRPPDARSDSVVHERDMEATLEFKRKERGQDSDDMLSGDSGEESETGEPGSDEEE